MALIRTQELFQRGLSKTAADYFDDDYSFSVGRGGIAGRLYYQQTEEAKTIDMHEVGIKVTINRLKRHCLYLESTQVLPITASCQLIVQPLGKLEGGLLLDNTSVNKKNPDHYQYRFLTNNWLSVHQLHSLVLD
ncbi:hypothetical protein [Photobacterium minamisatsumaniensis]|uniref:hypothetical protein n=1 Tax=Photobacterium minamisatsumaniensis TaxID=2910233 RepID=UPI003D14AC74